MTVGCPILIGDGLKGTDDVEVPVEGGEYVKAAKIDEAGKKLQNIGSSVENVGKKFLPVTAAASSNANTNVSMMGETFKYCAPIASALGFSAEDP